MTGHRVQVSVFLEPEVHKAAKQRAGEMKISLSATVAEAAKESLLSSYRSERENQILKAAERNFYAVRRLEQRLRIDLQVVKELIGLGMRSFFNHTPPVPDNGKTAALVSGKQRFQRYLDLVASNLRGGDSVLGDVPLPEPTEVEMHAVPEKDKTLESNSPTPQPNRSSKNDATGGQPVSASHSTSHPKPRDHPNRHNESSLFETRH
jgi:hypothetical protein